MTGRKKYIWAFPGLGKSSVHHVKLKVEDADCEQFKYIFPDGIPPDLHRERNWSGICVNPDYPDNYLNHISSVDADVVLLNCHINLLTHLNKEDLLLVYPSQQLKGEYLSRYRDRGDPPSYLSYMEETFTDIIQAIHSSAIRKWEITKPNVYLQNLFDGGNIMDQFMTKKELTHLLDESMQFGTFAPSPGFSKESPADLAQKVFEGEITLDISALKKATQLEKDKVINEMLARERRGGLSREELADKILQGIVNGALGIRYCEVAPYSHGYEVTFGPTNHTGSTHGFTNRWTCYAGDLFSVPYTVADAISKGAQSHEVFGSKCGPLDINAMLRTISEMENQMITSFTPEEQTDFVRATSSHRYPFRSSVATVMDVHAGKGLDGIVQHHYHGDYSTITPAKQNSLVETLVCLKGFCLDCIDGIDIWPSDRKHIVEYLKSKGTDISTPEKLEDWIKQNPEKCGLKENRIRKESLDHKINQASTRVADPTTDPVARIPEAER